MPSSSQRSLFAPVVLLLMLASVRAQSLDDVVVSASRAQARSFDTPAAIQLVDRGAIQNGGPQVNLSESLVRVPGLTMLDRSNYAQDLQVSIRGFGARSAFGIRGIRLLIDGIPASTPDGQGQGSSVSLTSMDHIEVLRGPLAQLYGNASGGVIQAFTKPASTVPLLDYQYFLGDYGLHRADYQFSDTVGDYGIVADYSTFSIDGFRDNSRTERKQFNGKLDFNPNDQTRVNLVFNQFDMPLAQDPLGLTPEQWAANPQQQGRNSLGTMTAAQFGVRKIISQNQLGGSAVYSIDKDHSVTSRMYYGTRDNLQFQVGTTGINANGAWTGLNRTYYGVGVQYNEKMEVADTPVEWVAGYEFDRSRELRKAGTASQGQQVLTNRNEENQAENSDLFAQGTAQVSDSIALVGGLRSSSVRFASTDYQTNGVASGDVSYGATNPVLGMTYFASDHLNLYVNYGQGFETPTLAEVAYKTSGGAPVGAFNPLLNASTSRHYEVGTKWVPDRTSRIDLAVFQIDATDEIVVDATAGGKTSYKSAPGTSRTGIELGASTQITPQMTASLSANFIDAKYSQTFTSATVTGATTINAGNKIPGIPQTSVFSELAWTSEQARSGAKAPSLGTRLALEMVQSGRIFANDTNTASVDGHTVFNVSASQRWAVEKAAVSAYLRLNNASNERYAGSVIVNSAQYIEPGLPRNWMLGLSVTAPF
jgi:iron complex outermembrane receptor protein